MTSWPLGRHEERTRFSSKVQEMLVQPANTSDWLQVSHIVTLGRMSDLRDENSKRREVEGRAAVTRSEDLYLERKRIINFSFCMMADIAHAFTTHKSIPHFNTNLHHRLDVAQGTTCLPTKIFLAIHSACGAISISIAFFSLPLSRNG